MKSSLFILHQCSWCLIVMMRPSKLQTVNTARCRHTPTPLSCCTVTRTPTSQHPHLSATPGWFPRSLQSDPREVAAATASCHVANIRCTAEVTPLTHTTYGYKSFLSTARWVSSLPSEESFETCWSLCSSPSWCLLCLPQRKVNGCNVSAWFYSRFLLSALIDLSNN